MTLNTHVDKEIFFILPYIAIDTEEFNLAGGWFWFHLILEWGSTE